MNRLILYYHKNPTCAPFLSVEIGGSPKKQPGRFLPGWAFGLFI
jgi:hypothetical protein